MPMPSRTVHVLDDDVAVRRSLQQLLSAAGLVPILYATPFELLEAAPPAEGCLLLDVRMPRMSGLEVQEWLNRHGVHLPIVMMTARGDVSTAVRAMKAGALDFLEKPFDDEALLAAVRAALEVGTPDDRTRAVADATERIAALSPRERQVLDALMAGRANKTIAEQLGISVRTVEVHRARMLARLGTDTLAEAVRLAVIAQQPSLP
jgi:two-component system response regulator FixJ